MIKLLDKIDNYYKFRKANLKHLPLLPGIYLFLNFEKKIIYIGKAKSLRERVKSYFNKNLYGKTDRLVKSVDCFSFIKVESEVESILLEAKLISKYKPVYNISLKDDKSPIYVYLTNADLPYLTLSRKKQIDAKAKSVWGPFTNSGNLKCLLKSIRRIVPYANHKPSNKNCLYSQMGLCNPCPSQIVLEENADKHTQLIRQYKKNLSNIRLFFAGHFKKLEGILLQQMKTSSQNQDYEKAQIFKNRVTILKEITSPRIIPETYIQDPYYSDKVTKSRLNSLKTFLNRFMPVTSVEKIECYDIAHLQGTNAAGSMVVFHQGKPDRSKYRHFRLRVSKNSDVDSLNEIIKRRTNHFYDWGIPDLIIVDGGKGQVNVFKKAVGQYNIPVVGIAKRFERLLIPTSSGFIQTKPDEGALFIVEYLRDEAHRFAQRYHHMLVSKNLLNIVE